MKQFDNFLCISFFSFLLYSIVSGQNFVVSTQHCFGISKQLNEGYVVINYDGDNFTSIGDIGTTFIGGVRFRNNPLGFYTGNVLVFVQFYYTQPATGLTILIYDAGTPNTPGTLLLSQPLNPNYLTVGDWNQISLNPGVVISGNDLWVCLQVEDSTAAYSTFGCDAGPAVDPTPI